MPLSTPTVFWRLFWQQLRVPVAVLWGVAMVFSLVFNEIAYWLIHQQDVGTFCLGVLVGSLLYLAILMFCYAVHWISMAGILWLSGIFLFSTTHLLWNMGLNLNDEIVACLFEAGPQEVFVYLNVYSGIGVGLFGLGCFYLAYRLNEFKSVGQSWRIRTILAALSLFVGNLLYWLPYDCVLRDNFTQAAQFPVYQYCRCLEMVDLYFTEVKDLRSRLCVLQDPAQSESIRTTTEPVTIVVHWGESLRADHLPMNGYERNTMPRLSRRKEQLVVFPKCISFATNTRKSTLGSLSGADLDTQTPRYRGFMALFNKHEFVTHAHVLPQGEMHEMPAFTLLQDAQTITQIAEHDITHVMRSVPDICRILQANRARSILFYINNIGSHTDFFYEEHNRQFVPDERSLVMPTGFPVQNFVNAYDNSILQTDEFIDSVLTCLQEQNAVYFYCADHGIALGEREVFGHAYDDDMPQARYVACFVWMSPLFEQTYPAVAQALRNNAQQLPIISHEHFFHTVLGLGGIESSILNLERNLCAPTAKPYTGPYPVFPEYEVQLSASKTIHDSSL